MGVTVEMGIGLTDRFFGRKAVMNKQNAKLLSQSEHSNKKTLKITYAGFDLRRGS